MKNLSLLAWLTQLGLSVAVPLAGCVFLGVWLHQHQGWGVWTVWTGVILGILLAVEGLRSSLKAMERMSKEQQDKPPVGYNEHD